MREFEGGLMRFWFFTAATRREEGLRAEDGGAWSAAAAAVHMGV